MRRGWTAFNAHASSSRATASTSSQPIDNRYWLPVEIWERIIDTVADDNLGPHGRDLLACCLTCRSWVPRSRFHIFTSVNIRTRSHLTSVVDCLSRHWFLCYCIVNLTIDVTDAVDQSWLSSCVLLLGPKIKAINSIFLRGIDLTTVHPAFFQTLKLFPDVTFLGLYGIRYTRHGQLAQLASGLRAATLRVQDFGHGPGKNWRGQAQAATEPLRGHYYCVGKSSRRYG